MQKSTPPNRIAQVCQTVLPIEARNICVRGSENQFLLDALTLSVAGSGLTVVMGPNGAGKSLLLRVLTGLVEPSSGALTWAGAKKLGPAVKQIGFVFQKPVLFRRTTLENITFALRTSGRSSANSEQVALGALKAAELLHLKDAPARRLSGGEQQRVAIARALSIEPEVLFLDEPTAHLDPPSTAIIEAMILSAKRHGMRVVHVTHDSGQARRLADDVVFLHRGKLLEQSPAATFFTEPKSKAAADYLAGKLVLTA